MTADWDCVEVATKFPLMLHFLWFLRGFRECVRKMSFWQVTGLQIFPFNHLLQYVKYIIYLMGDKSWYEVVDQGFWIYCWLIPNTNYVTALTHLLVFQNPNRFSTPALTLLILITPLLKHVKPQRWLSLSLSIYRPLSGLIRTDAS